MRKRVSITFLLILSYIIMAAFIDGIKVSVNSMENIQNIKNISSYELDQKKLFNKELATKEYMEKGFSNADKYMVTPTYDLSGEAVHPKVLYVKDGWRGYKYWMGITPYPQGDDDFENPQLLVSNDGKRFKMLSVSFRPIIRPLDALTGGHYSDICLCIVNDTLEMYFRYNPARPNGAGPNNSVNIVYRMTSSDGKNWSDKKRVLDGNSFRENYGYVSPAVIYVNGIYKLWFSEYDGRLFYTETKDWKTYKEPVNCVIKGQDKNLRTWHQDIIYTDAGYEMVTNAYWHPDFYPHNLYYSCSKDGINFGPLKEVLRVSRKNDTFDNKTLYKSSLVKVGKEYKLYYSACDLNGHWHIALAKKD